MSNINLLVEQSLNEGIFDNISAFIKKRDPAAMVKSNRLEATKKQAERQALVRQWNQADKLKAKKSAGT